MTSEKNDKRAQDKNGFVVISVSQQHNTQLNRNRADSENNESNATK